MGARWLFRGQGDSTWPLTPGLLRPQNGIRDPRAYEASMLDTLRRHLKDKTFAPEHLLDGADAARTYLLPLAQHYGALTRFLDWSLSPLVAAAFAASCCLRLRSKVMSVFAFARPRLSIPALKTTAIITPVVPLNEHITAQRGLLVQHDWDVPDLWLPEFQIETTTPPEPSEAYESRLIRFDLPIEQARALLIELDFRGADLTTLFPGPKGYVEAAMDVAAYNDSFDDPPITTWSEEPQ